MEVGKLSSTELRYFMEFSLKDAIHEIISDTIKNLKGVVDAEVIDIYRGNQIPPGI